ncbi:MAG: hypothetical protein ACYCST_19390 [Acidimicrobiales bacterium]
MNGSEKEVAAAQVIAVLYAVAGCSADARKALVELHPVGLNGLQERCYERFALHLGRWLDGGGDRAALPSGPPVWRPESRDAVARQDWLKAMVAAAPDARARGEAFAAVRRKVERNTSAEEARAMLRAEFERRGDEMDTDVPDAQVEVLFTAARPFGRTRLLVRALSVLREGHRNRLRGRAGGSAEVAGEESRGECLRSAASTPTWLVAPARAAYPILGAGLPRVPVRLDGAMRKYLARAMEGVAPFDASAPLRASRLVTVWLASADHEADGRLDVYLGERRVGWLDAAEAEPFQPAMRPAAERDEDPRVTAFLRRTAAKMPYLLEITPTE